MRSSLGRITLTAVLAAMSAVGVPAGGAVAAPAGGAATVPAAPSLPTGMLTALQRDLGVDPGAVRTLLDSQDAATPIAERLGAELGGAFGGAWFDIDARKPVVATTDAAQLGRIRAAGADARVVSRSQRDLDAAKATLDRSPAPDDVTGLYVDVRANRVIVRALPAGVAAARHWIKASGTDPALVDVVAAAGRPTDDAGDAMGGGRTGGCTIGFAVVGGFTTAGHCGKVGDRPTGANGTVQGTYEDVAYPGTDMAWVRTDASWTPRPLVLGGPAWLTRISQHGTALVGASVCKAGRVTGWNCGTVTALNATRFRAGDDVTGLTQTDVCAAPGDSGGPFISGTIALGMHSGRLGDQIVCGEAGVHTAAYQPIKPALDRFGLTLLVSPGTIRAMYCGGNGQPGTFRCTVLYNPGNVTFRYRVNGVTGAPSNANVVQGSCTPGTVVTVEATVSEAVAGSDTASRRFTCLQGIG